MLDPLGLITSCVLRDRSSLQSWHFYWPSLSSTLEINLNAMEKHLLLLIYTEIYSEVCVNLDFGVYF